MSPSTFFPGRLGLAEARIPHADRHGLVWLFRGNLYVEDGTLRFSTAGSEEFEPGDYAIPYQAVSMVLMGPGTSITHDALRILARHGTLVAAIGEGGTKFYTAPPIGQGRSEVARAHAKLWANEKSRLDVARRMYALRFGEILPTQDLRVLRGIEGARLRKAYQLLAEKFGLSWKVRKYDREHPETNDPLNQAVNHAATFMEAAADIAVAAVGALPPLGFIHEDSSNAFCLDIADLWRTELTLPLAFSVLARVKQEPGSNLEREIRYEAAKQFRRKQLIPRMIDTIKELLRVDDRGGDA